MFRRFVRGILILGLLVAFAMPAWADDPVENGLTYLATQQQADGGFTNGFSEGSDLGTTCDVILAIVAAGRDPQAWRSAEGHSPLDYLQAQVTAGAANTPGLQAKVALALAAMGVDPAAWGAPDPLTALEAAYDPASGSFGSTLFDQALAMLALHHYSRPIPEQAVAYLLDNQTEDGAWALLGGTEADTGDTNTTALVIQALLAAGNDEALDEALAYLQRVQNQDGGFPYQNPSDYGTDTDANSTAYVLQALTAAGQSLDDWAPAGVDPRSALEALYDPASGAFFWQAAYATPNVLATAQAIPALAGYTFLDLPRLRAASSTPTPAPPVLPATGGVAPLWPGLALLLAAALGVGLALQFRRR